MASTSAKASPACRPCTSTWAHMWTTAPWWIRTPWWEAARRSAPTEAVNNVSNGSRGYISPLLRGSVEVSAAFHLVAEKSLLFQPPQYRANRGVFHRVALPQRFAALLRRGRPAAPD